MSLVLDEHRRYLGDAARVDTYAAALTTLVAPGHVVVDLGCGTGLLGLIACRAGARRVYAIDATPTIQVAKALAADNGFGDRVVPVRGRSTEVSLPEPADLVVADQLGPFAYGAGLFESLADARTRFLKPGGATIPSAVTLLVAAIESPAAYERVAFWTREVAGVRLNAAAPIAANTPHGLRLHARELLGEAARSVCVPCDAVPDAIEVDAESVAARDGELHGIGGWFEAVLAPGVVLTNDPRSPSCMDREQIFLPLARPLAVRRGDRIRLHVTLRPMDLVVSWRAAVDDPGGQNRSVAAQSSFSGLLVGAADLRRLSAGARPAVSARGAARREVLALCDGSRLLTEIEREILERHPGVFGSRAEVARFVAEVVARDAAS